MPAAYRSRGDQRGWADSSGQVQLSDELVGLLADNDVCDLANQEAGHGHRAGLVRLGTAEDDVSPDIGEGPANVDPAAAEVDVTDAQGSCLALAQARVTEQQDEHASRSGRVGQVAELVVGQVHVVAAVWLGQAEPAGGVGAEPD